MIQLPLHKQDNKSGNQQAFVRTCFRISILTLLFSSFSLTMNAQEWKVPSDENNRLSPFAFTDSTRKAGAELYGTNCKSCHGDPGKNNAINLTPPPPDPASAKMQGNSDGALHYKLTVGRGAMPSFKNNISSNNLWVLISYLRSYNEKYVQVIGKKEQGGATGIKGSIALKWDKAANHVLAVVNGTKDQLTRPLKGTEVRLFAARYFGNLPIGDAKTTDEQGIAAFDWPTDLPGDSTGNVKLIAKLMDEASFGETATDTTMAIGKPTWKPALNQQRAMWNVVQKTPIWLLLTYILGVLTIWGFIILVAFQVGKALGTNKKDTANT